MNGTTASCAAIVPTICAGSASELAQRRAIEGVVGFAVLGITLPPVPVLSAAAVLVITLPPMSVLSAAAVLLAGSPATTLRWRWRRAGGR